LKFNASGKYKVTMGCSPDYASPVGYFIELYRYNTSDATWYSMGPARYYNNITRSYDGTNYHI